MDTVAQAKKIKLASKYINKAKTCVKNNILKSIGDSLRENMDLILGQNQKDLEAARENKMPKHLVDRLTLTPERIESMALGVFELISLPDPSYQVVWGQTRPSGLRIEKIQVPIGLIGVIYESRPNVSVDVAALCIKSGNAVLLRGGKESIHTNTVLVELMQNAIEKNGVDPNIIGLVKKTDRSSALEMMKMRGILDVLIPRGSAGLIKSVSENSTVPVIETGVGNCHIYIDQSADIDMAIRITVNAKTSRPSVCNSAESLLVHKSVAEIFLKRLKDEFDKSGVELVGCPRAKQILPEIQIASEDDYYAEYLGYKMSVKVVDSVQDAAMHINKYSSGHSEAIVTSDYFSSEYFLKEVDSAAVYVNASTRFTDGNEFGLGAEIGISTQKLHARGPMGLKDLTTPKFIVRGDGQIRSL